MVATLTARNQLQQAIFAAQELTGNLLYELAVVRKMEYQIAWELATREWAFLPDEEDRPQLSFDPATLDPKPTLTRDFRITSADRIGEGSLREKAQANLAAIRTLKRIEDEDRLATPEEKAVLVKYTGWGAMPGAFEPQPSRDWKGIAHELRDVLGRGGICVGPCLDAERALHFSRSHSGDLEGDGAIWLPARWARTRTFNGCGAFLRAYAGEVLSRHATHRRGT